MLADLTELKTYFRLLQDAQKTLKSAHPFCSSGENIGVRKVIGTIMSRPQLQQALIMDILISTARLRAADM
jgi:hypothetical protein